MNVTTQHDYHPDAESLSAYAELALSERERGQMLEHLAVCGRCRQVVALAQKACLDTESAPPAAKRAVVQPYAWWRIWRFAWIPAAALAAAFAGGVFVHMRHLEQSAEMAKNERERVTQAAATPEAPVQQEQAQAAPPAAAPKAAKSPARTSRRASEGAAPNPPSQERVGTAAMPVPFPDESGGIEHHRGARAETAPPPAAAAPEFEGEGLAPSLPMAAYTPEPPVGAWQQERKQKAAAGTPQGRMYAARAPAVAALRGADGGTSGSSTERATVSSPQTQQQPQPVPRPAAPTPSGALITPDGVEKNVYLPDGLRIESMAAAGPRVLAIDSAGALFLSEDSGDTWEHVTPQWTGRAVKVHRQMTGSAMEAVPTEFFELLNDQGQVWLSTDGKTWTAK